MVPFRPFREENLGVLFSGMLSVTMPTEELNTYETFNTGYTATLI